jgi:hypothetical protein
MSSSRRQPKLLFVMDFIPEGYLYIVIATDERLAWVIPPPPWRNMEVEQFKTSQTISIVTLDNMQEELADIAAYLFKGMEVDAWWFESTNGSRH